MICRIYFFVVFIRFVVIWKPTVGQPSAPTGLDWTNIYSSSIGIEWNRDNTGTITGYKVVAGLSANSVTDCSAGEDAGFQSSFGVTKDNKGKQIQASTTYYVGVCAVDVNGTSSVPRKSGGWGTGPHPPAIDVISSPSPNQLFVSWTPHCNDPCGGFDDDKQPKKYIIAYTSTDDGSSITSEVLPEGSKFPATSITLEQNVKPNTEYDVTVMTMTYENMNQQRIFSDASDVATNATLPLKVDLPTTAPPSTSSVTLSWKEVDGNAKVSYTISWTSNQGPGQINNIIGSSTTIKNLTSNTLYNFSVTAVNDAGSGIASDVVQATTGITFPSSFTAEPKTYSILLKWEEPTGGEAVAIQEYSIHWVSDSGAMGENRTSCNTTELTDLRSNDKYNIFINAVSIDGKNGSTTNMSSTTLFAMPSAITVKNKTEDSMAISWEAPEKGGSAYDKVAEYFIFCASVVGNQNCSKTASKNSVMLDRLISNTEYAIQVAARNTENGPNGEFSEFELSVTLLNKSNSLWIRKTSEQTLVVEWMEPEIGGGAVNITEYEVTWSSKSEDDSMTVNSTKAEIHQLTSNSEYNITVIAFGDQEYGIPSDILTAFTLPSEPVNLSTETISSTNVLLKWEDAVDEGTAQKNYTVTWTSDQTNGTKEGVNEISTNILNLTSNTEYSFNIYAVNAGGFGKSSTAETSITFPATPNSPTSKSATASSITLQWVEKEEGPVERTYTIFWKRKSDAILNNETADSNNETTVKNLNGSSFYLFSLRSENEEGSAINFSDEAMLLTTPGKPNASSSVTGVDNTTAAFVYWNKPDGGDEIDGYTLQWTATSGDLPQNYTPHINGTNEYSLFKTGLIPGEMYTVIIIANNSAGFSSEEIHHRAYPGSVSNLTVTQNKKNPLDRLDVIWDRPDGVGDKTEINYTSIADGSTKSMETDNYNITSLSIPVQPGTTYEVLVNSVSGDLKSTKQTYKMNSQPSALTITNAEVTKNSVKFTWEFNGFAESVIIKVVNYSNLNTDINNTSVTEYELTGLKPDTNYTMRLYTVITNVFNEEEPSEINEQRIKTSPDVVAPPPDVGLIVGLTITGVLILIAVILGVWYYRRRKRSRKPKSIPRPCTSRDQFSNEAYRPKERREIRLTEFKHHLESLHANSDMQFSDEYQQFRNAVIDPSVNASLLEENKPKNRFKNVLAYDATRVILSNVGDAPTDDYINANYISGYSHDREYIASQGPLPNTKDDFWKMVWEQDCKTIVMVTQTVEGGRVKCDHYWPYDNKPITVAEMSLKLLEEVDSGDWIVRKLELQKNQNTRVISHFHYTAWPDHGVPETTKSVVQFVQLVRSHIKHVGPNTGPSVVHCSAGVGRTGTFIAIDHLLQHLKEHPYVDIYGIVYEMRKQRNLMVQTEGQYVFLHHVVEDYLDKEFDDEKEQEPVYENAGFVKDPIYENTNYGDSSPNQNLQSNGNKLL